MSQPPSGPPPEGHEPPEPADEAPYGAHGPPAYGSPGYGPAPYGPPQQGQPPYGPPQPWDPYYGPPPAGRNRRGLAIALVGGLMVLAVCVAVTAVLVLRDDRSGPPAALPPGVTATTADDGSVTMVKKGAKAPVVDVYLDFQCSVCKEFHRVNDATLMDLAGQGKAKVVYHPMVIFNDEPQGGNSLRAAVSARCVDDGGRWLAFQDQLFAHQPPEGSTGFRVSELLAYGRAARLTSSTFTDCVREQRHIVPVREASRVAVDSGVYGTPTVKVNGTALPGNETLTVEGLRNAVAAAG